MNEITQKLFNLIAENTGKSLQQIKVLITTSITLKNNNLSHLAIDFNAEQAPIFELPEKTAKNKKLSIIAKRKNQSEPFRLTPLAFAIYYNNLPAFKLLLEQGLSINAGHPSPLWCAVYRKADITTIEMLIVKGANFNYEYPSNLNLDNFLIEHSEERKNNYLYSSSTYKATSPLFMAVISENVSLAKLLLLHGAMPTASVKQSLLDQSNKLTKPYKERYLENDIGYKYVQEQQERLVATVTLPLNKLFTCIEEIELVKQAFNAKQSSKLTKHVASACEYDMIFFLDYLHMTVKKINLFQYYDNQPPSYIPACLSVFVFITKLSNFSDPAMFNYFQQKLLLEIEGHDADSNPHKLFTNNQEKHAWFELMSTDTDWQKTLHVMNASSTLKSTEVNAYASPKPSKINVLTDAQQKLLQIEIDKLKQQNLALERKSRNTIRLQQQYNTKVQFNRSAFALAVLGAALYFTYAEKDYRVKLAGTLLIVLSLYRMMNKTNQTFSHTCQYVGNFFTKKQNIIEDQHNEVAVERNVLHSDKKMM